MTAPKVQKIQTLSQIYDVGDFIDAKDNQGDWRVGYIIEKLELNKIYKVRFDGWASKYDENYRFSTAKFKPFRSVVLGYTGQKQNPAIRTEWTFSLQDHKKKVLKFQAAMQKPEEHSVHQLNQILRGHNYFYADYLMTYNFSSVQEIALANQFFKINLDFLAQYLKYIENNFEKFMSSIQSMDLAQNSSVAFDRSFYEIFDTCFIIGGNYSRLHGWFKDNSELIKQVFQPQEGKEIKDPKKMFKIYMEKYFILDINGIDVISRIIKKMKQYNEVMPFLFLSSFTNLFYGLSSQFSKSDKQNFIQLLMEIGEKNMRKMKDLHFKDFHRFHAIDLFNSIEELSYKTSLSDKCQQWNIYMELQLCLKMITCPYFEKKLKGITQLSQLCERKQYILSNDELKNWISESKLFEILFINNDNPELAKKSAQLAKYLFVKHNLTQQNIDMIWKSRIGKHETFVKEIYELIADLPIYETNVAKSLSLFTKLIVPEKQWDEDYIKLIRQFTLNSLGRYSFEKIHSNFGFEILHTYCLKNPTNYAFEQFAHVLNRFSKSEFFIEFCESCFQNVQQKINTQTNIKLLLTTCDQRIDCFDKINIQMTPIIVSYLVNNSHDQKKSKSIGQAFELLQQISKNSKKQKISLSHFKQLWDNFTISKTRSAFMKWLYKKRQKGKINLNTIFKDDLRNKLLNELWKQNNAERYHKIDIDEAVFFIELFKSTNVLNQKIKRINLVFKINSFELIGYQLLWNMFIFAQNQNVVKILIDFISEIHTSYYEQDMEQSIQKIVHQIVETVKKAQQAKNIHLLEKILHLTKRIILRDEQVYHFSYIPRTNMIKQYTITNKAKNQQKSFRFNTLMSFYDFKKIVSQKFSLHLHNCRLYTFKNQLVTYESYFKSMIQGQFGFKFTLIEETEIFSEVKNCLNKQLDMFFQLLGDKRIQKLVWSIVSKLPISTDLQQRIQKTENFFEEMNKVGFYKELYMLKVILELDQTWWLKFSKVENLELLIKSYKKITLKSDIQLEYLNTLTEIILKMTNQKAINLDKIGQNLFSQSIIILKQLLVKINKQEVKNPQLEVRIISQIFMIGLKVTQSHNALSILLESKVKEQFLLLGLVSIKQTYIRKKFNENLKKLIEKSLSKQVQIKFYKFLLRDIFKMVIDWKHKENLRQYFDFTTYFLSTIKKKQLYLIKQTEDKNIVQNLFELIKNQQHQFSSEQVNVSLSGYLTLLKNFIGFEQKQMQEQVMKYIIGVCLFSNEISKCKTRQSRIAAFNVLKSLFIADNVIVKITQFLSMIHSKGQWRSKKIDDWSISQFQKQKSSTGYVGIRNLGCICYMNSFFQQIFMIPKFRKAVLACEDPTYFKEDEDENVLFQLQRMFLSLILSDKKYYDPRKFCHAFKDYEGNPTNVSEQMDIDEFSGILFDRLQNQMKGTKYGSLIKDTFGGVYSNQIVCKGCPHFSESEQSFLSISLTVKGKKNIAQSFDNMIKGDTLDGDNAFFCERCNKKVSAVKRVSLKKLPDHLFITLKRFQFDYQSMSKLKVNDYCEFPVNLNLKEYSRQHLREQQGKKSLDSEQMHPNEHFQYILKGVVVHLGYADSGHYYSFIKERNGKQKWFEFNDTVVRNFNFDDIAEEAYGGDSSGFQSKERIKNAYMLMYERVKKEKQGDVSNTSLEEIYQMPNYCQEIQKIHHENKEQKIQSIIFSYQYSMFVNGIANQIQLYKPQIAQKIIKYLITVYLTTTIRQKTDVNLYSFLKKIDQAINNNKEVGDWVLKLLSEQRVLEQFFKHDPIKENKKLISFWLIELFRKSKIKSVKKFFVNLLLNKIVKDNQNINEFCIILYEISSDSSILDYIVSENIVGRLVQNFLKKENRIFVDQLETIKVTQESEIGYQTIDKPDQPRKIKYDNENAYVWAIINRVIARSQQKKIKLEQYITKVQTDYLYKLPQEKLYKILEEIRNKLQLYEFISLLSYLSTGNEDFTIMVGNLIYNGLKQFQSKRYRQFFLLYERFIKIQDPYKSLRLDTFQKIIQALNHNEQYSLDSNIIQQWIIILVNRNINLRKYLMDQKEYMEYLYKLTTKKVPSEEIAKKNNIYGDFMLNKLHGVKFPKTKKAYTKLSREMQEFYDNLIQDKYEQSPIWSSVEELIQKDISVGDVIAIFDSKQKLEFQEGKVQSIFLSRLQIQTTKKSKPIFVWKDDEKISLNLKFIQQEQQNDLSSQTTEMDIEDQDDDLFDEV